MQERHRIAAAPVGHSVGQNGGLAALTWHLGTGVLVITSAPWGRVMHVRLCVCVRSTEYYYYDAGFWIY